MQEIKINIPADQQNSINNFFNKLEKFSQYQSIDRTGDYLCPCCYHSTPMGGGIFYQKAKLAGWCDTEEGFMAVYECPECFTKFRLHINGDRKDFEKFKEALYQLHGND